MPDGPEPCSAPAGTFAFLPSNTPSLFALEAHTIPSQDAGDGQLIVPFPRSQGREGSQPSSQPSSGATTPRFGKTLITTCV